MRSARSLLFAALAVFSVAFLPVPLRAADGPASGGVKLIDSDGLWRKYFAFFPPRVTVAGAKEKGTETDAASRTAYFDKYCSSGFCTPPPPAGWAEVGFDDSTWQLAKGEQFEIGDSRAWQSRGTPGFDVYRRATDPFVEEVGEVCMRAAFQVNDPGKVRRLLLSLSYRGGFVAYLNGTEFARGSLPAAALAYDTAAADYPLGAWFVEDGGRAQRLLHWFTDAKSTQWPLRERTAGPIELPLGLLVKGRNVLGLELHRSDYPAELKRRGGALGFATVGLGTLSLTADAADGAVASYAPKAGGLQVFNADLAQAIRDGQLPPPEAKLGPVRIVAVPNGTFSGKVVLTAASPLAAVRATAGELRQQGGSGRIAADACTVRFAAVNPTWKQTGRMDMLLDSPPQDAKTTAVWLTVRVPKGTAAGQYAGTLRIEAAGPFEASVPVNVAVIGWPLADVKDYGSLLNIYQSPDTLARYYGVEPWGEPHWRLIERSLRLMGEAGNIGLFFPLLAKSQFGNVESMVLWVRKPGGKFEYDFTRLDRYLSMALKYHTRLRFLALCAWGTECRAKAAADGLSRAAVTVRDAATGQSEDMALPAYGTPACEAMLRSLLEAVRARLAERGLDKLLLLGLPADGSPEAETVAMFRRILPDARWIRESHYDVRSFRYDASDRNAAVPVAYNSVVWGGAIPDPAEKRLYGWRYDPAHLVMNFNRAGTECLVLNGFPPPWSYRMWMESTLACGRNGNGRVGGDYWVIGAKFVGDGRISSEAQGGSSGTLYGIYLASAVGQVGLGNSTTDLFGPGPDGPVSTVRFQNALEGNQEAEARIAIERALLDQEHPLPEALAAKCQTLLDERTMVLRMWPIGAADIAQVNWQARSRRLYEAAAEVAAALQAGNGEGAKVRK